MNDATPNATIWDPFDERFIEDPFPANARLREDFPVYLNQERGFYALSRWDDVVEANRDWATFSNAEGVDLDNTGSIFFGEGDVVETDSPDQSLFRTVLTDHISGGFVRGQEEHVTRSVDQLVTSLQGCSQVDPVADFCTLLPLGVVCGMLGLDASDHTWVYGRFMDMFVRESGSQEIPPSALAAAAEVRDYLATNLAASREQPRGDLLSAIAHGKVGERSLTHVEQVGMSTLVIAARISTTKDLLSNIFWYMAQEPALRRDVENAAAQAPMVIEEILRFDSPIQNSSRTATREVELHDMTIPEGATVALVYGSANRDPEQFPNPDNLDVTCQVGIRMAFGVGVHLCIGAPLARLEAKVVLQQGLHRRAPFTLAGAPERPVAASDGRHHKSRKDAP